MDGANVVFKGKRGGIEVLFDGLTPFEALKEELKTKLNKNSKFFGKRADVKVSAVVSRKLEEEERVELLTIFSEYFNEDGIEFVSRKTEERAARTPRTRREALEMASPSAPRSAEDKGLFVRSTIRSGQRVHSEGNVTVMGDVNPGAELVAGGNIVVLGTLRGVAHAGALGDADAVVFALNLQPTQLRIADMIAIAPPKEQKTDYPELALARQGKIVIEPYNPGVAAHRSAGALPKV